MPRLFYSYSLYIFSARFLYVLSNPHLRPTPYDCISPSLSLSLPLSRLFLNSVSTTVVTWAPILRRQQPSTNPNIYHVQSQQRHDGLVMVLYDRARCMCGCPGCGLSHANIWFPIPQAQFHFLKKFEGIDVCGWLKLVTEYNYLSAPRKVYRLALHPQILCTKVSITNNVLDRSEFLFWKDAGSER